MQMGAVNFSADDRAPDQYDAVYISWNGFSLIGTQPVIGRGFSAEDDRPGAPAVVLLSYTVWQSRYGGDRSVVGRAISRELRNRRRLSASCRRACSFRSTTEVWLPACAEAHGADARGPRGTAADGVRPARRRHDHRTGAHRDDRHYRAARHSVSRHQQGHHRRRARRSPSR